MSDAQEKTEPATEKRMKEVRKKGQLATSKDLVSWLGVAAGTIMIPPTIAAMQGTSSAAVLAFRTVIADPEPARAVAALGTGLGGVIPAITPMLVVVAVTLIAATVLQGGLHLKMPTAKFEQFNLLSGVKRVFGTQALWEGAKALAKTAVVGVAMFSVMQGLLPVLMVAGGLPVSKLVDATAGGVGSIMQTAIGAGLALAVADVIVVMRRNRKSTRMSKREVRDENKSSEGDPMIRAQRRSRQLEMGRSRMLAAVSGADVVLLNPTHIAVALKYEPGKSAPRVIAKGADAIALRIREKATEAGVPMVEDIPLARALHAACEVGQEIPADLYSAVARVLAFVMSLKTRGAAKGTHRLAPQSI